MYKVHTHCSSYSSNETWLSATMPTVAIISAGDRNEYGYVAVDCVELPALCRHRNVLDGTSCRCHALVRLGHISGTTVISVDLSAMQFSVVYGTSDVYAIGRPPQDTSYFTRTSFPF